MSDTRECSISSSLRHESFRRTPPHSGSDDQAHIGGGAAQRWGLAQTPLARYGKIDRLQDPVPRYRSQIWQSLHYFARPHEQIRRTPLTGPAVWRGDAMAEAPWQERLDEHERAELEAGLDHACALRRPTGTLTRRDFPVPGLRARFAAWRDQLQHGRGFVVIRGLPVGRWSAERTERFFWCFGLHLGFPGAQNPQGELLGHVRDTGAPMDGSVRQYRTAESIDYHCDLADVVGLLCVRPARRGGQSRIVSTVYAYNELLRRRPALIDRLYAPLRLDTKGEGGIPYIPIEPCRYANGQLRTFWHTGYFRSIERYRWAPPLTPDERALLDTYDEIFAEPGVALQMDLRPGDIQLLSNHVIAHGRTAFEDGDEPRHLLRLWLSLPHEPHPRLRLRREQSRLRLLGRLARLRLRHRGGRS